MRGIFSIKTIDLTHNIANGMMIYPGDPQICISEGLTHEKDYCHVDQLHLNSHTGTHIDAPLHFIADSKTITDYPTDKFINEGIAIDLRHKTDGEAITVDDLAPAHIEAGMSVVLATGWYQYFNTERYLNHPYISKEADQYLVDKKVSIVAVDFLNVDQTLVEAWDAHPILLGNDTLIVENINNSLELAFDRTYILSFLPLKVVGTDGSPVRAVAMVM